MRKKILAFYVEPTTRFAPVYRITGALAKNYQKVTILPFRQTEE
jgi:hypothetical protein